MPDQAARAPDANTAQVELFVGAMAEMVGRPGYPGLGASPVFRRDRATVRVYDELDAPATALLLLQDLREWAYIPWRRGRRGAGRHQPWSSIPHERFVARCAGNVRRRR